VRKGGLGDIGSAYFSELGGDDVISRSSPGGFDRFASMVNSIGRGQEEGWNAVVLGRQDQCTPLRP
jgi:hypothetical protein